MSPQPSPLARRALRARRWLDQRTGCDRWLRWALDEPIPGGARWAYIFGSGLLFLLVTQIITGVFLALYYVPAANDAHITVAYIVKVVSAGSFIRGLHAYGASAIVVVVLLHLGQTFLFGSYKGRRELLWIAGCVLLLLVLGLAFTGYLLPWDERAYFATAVGTNVMGEAPLLGNVVKRLLRGGNAMGTLTLSRFFVLHVFVLPTLLIGFIVMHVYLFRRAGAAGPISADPFDPLGEAHPARARLRVDRFYPRQLFRDTVFALLLIAGLAALAHWFPVALGPEANPGDTTFLPRPEWYYLPLFEWLKFWPGRSALIGIVIVPTLLAVLFVAVPWLDRRIERHPRCRPLAVGLFLTVMGGLVALGILSHVQDRRDPIVALQLARQDRATAAYMRAPFIPQAAATGAGVATTGTAAAALSSAPPSTSGGAAPALLSGGAHGAIPAGATPREALMAVGAKSYADRGCSFCHGDNGEGSDQAPSLQAKVPTLTDAQLSAFLRNPSSAAQAVGMPVFDGTPQELQALIEYLRHLPKS